MRNCDPQLCFQNVFFFFRFFSHINTKAYNVQIDSTLSLSSPTPTSPPRWHHTGGERGHAENQSSGSLFIWKSSALRDIWRPAVFPGTLGGHGFIISMLFILDVVHVCKLSVPLCSLNLYFNQAAFIFLRSISQSMWGLFNLKHEVFFLPSVRKLPNLYEWRELFSKRWHFINCYIVIGRYYDVLVASF